MPDGAPTRGEDESERLREALEAEIRLRLDTQRQLAQANAEFEEFVSLAAHNLRESLRDVAAFSQLLAETHGGSLNSEAGSFLDRIREGAASAQSLLTDVVDYWSTIPEGRHSRMEMEAALTQSLVALEKQIAARSAIVTHDPLPPVLGDFAALGKVLQHLVRNAIEYCDARAPRIHISSRRVDPEWIFSVEDNGPGIAVEHQGRLFKAFKRLHGKEHAGNGLGLAFCKRVIEGHGGRLWLESTPGAGSTFYFTLPPVD
jgi:chemotaxis family two-component system sensor kinase Cph1